LNSRFAEMSDAEFQGMLGLSDEMPQNIDLIIFPKILNVKSWREWKIASNTTLGPIPEHFDARQHWPNCAGLINRIQASLDYNY
jgi:hypothetical protein